jgi:hypothetical protein
MSFEIDLGGFGGGSECDCSCHSSGVSYHSSADCAKEYQGYGVQMPIPYTEHAQTVTRTGKDGATHTYSGYNHSGRPGGIFEQAHTHTRTEPNGKVTYDRDINGINRANRG